MQSFNSTRLFANHIKQTLGLLVNKQTAAWEQPFNRHGNRLWNRMKRIWKFSFLWVLSSNYRDSRICIQRCSQGGRSSPSLIYFLCDFGKWKENNMVCEFQGQALNWNISDNMAGKLPFLIFINLLTRRNGNCAVRNVVMLIIQILIYIIKKI